MSSVKTNRFDGGITTIGSKVGEDNSAKFIKQLNVFEQPDSITLSRALTKVSSTTVADLVRWMQDGSPWNTNRYAYDEAGKIYQINSSDTVSLLRTVTGGGGEGLLAFDNYLYYPQATEIGRYGPLDNSPAFQDSFSGWWIASQLQTTGGGTGATDYTTPTSISEAATARQTFDADHDPIISITIDVDVVGTGDWTVTVHDSANNVIGAKTIANGSMSTGDVVFTFASVLRVSTAETYHFHVTSTVGDGGVDTDVGTDLEGAEFTVQYQALIDADFHPIIEMLGGWVVGNERYLGFFDNATFDPNDIELAPGFEVRTLSKRDEFVVAECWKGASFAEAEEARRYYWDGISPTWNYFEDLKVGAPNALVNHKNELIGVYGNRGSAYYGSGDLQEIIDEVPKLARGKGVEVYPGAIDNYEGKMVIGYSASTDDASGLEQGVYEFGSQTDKLASVLNYPFRLSTNTTQGTSLKIGCVKAFGQDLYIGWRDDTSYGIDKVTAGNNAVASGSWESRVWDGGDTDKYKQAIKVEVTFEPITANQTVTPKYKLDRASSFTTGTSVSTANATRATVYINKLCKEAEWGFNLASSDGSFPAVTGINFIYEPLESEDESA